MNHVQNCLHLMASTESSTSGTNPWIGNDAKNDGSAPSMCNDVQE